jgi:hypothetical protein
MWLPPMRDPEFWRFWVCVLQVLKATIDLWRK